MHLTDLGIIGGTGPAGRGLGVRLASAGASVVLGSRLEERAREAVSGALERWKGHELAITGGTNEDAACASVVVVATPWDAVAPTVGPLAEVLAGKVVISMANALVKVGRELQPLLLARGSVAAELQALLPRSEVAAAFHHLPAAELSDLDSAVDSDVLICSDHRRAIEETQRMVALVPGMRGLDAGRLSQAGALESFTAVLIGLNVRYRTHAAVRITGIASAERSGGLPSGGPLSGGSA
ncbi:MAG: NADPH-dependent F420 reductase [Acidimicrobiales bacterium]